MFLQPLAGETRFEHATDGFGDRNSTVELLPYVLNSKEIISECVSEVKALTGGLYEYV